MQTQQCNGQAVFLIYVNASLKFSVQRFLCHLAFILAFTLAFMLRCTPTGLHRTPRRQKLLVDSNELRHSRRQQKNNGRNIHGNTARTQNSWPARGREHVKRVAQARAQIALGWNGGRSRAAPEEIEAWADAAGTQRRRDTDRNRLEHDPIKLNRIMV
jgi:hypothetical protein